MKKRLKNLFNFLSLMQRRQKIGQFIELFHPDSKTLILDIGISDIEYRESDNLFEKAYPYPDRIVALGVGDLRNFKSRYPAVQVVVYDGQSFPFRDGVIDIVYLNAVIEHVGNYKIQRMFIQECFRVGKGVFVTTPNRFFPIEVHTKLPLLHYLPKKHFDRILRYIGVGWAADNYMHLLSYRQFKSLFDHDTEIEFAKNKFLGLTVTFTAARLLNRR